MLQLLVFVAKSIDLSLKFIGLLLFDHLDVTVRDLLYLREARVRKSVSSQPNINQRGVLVQCLEHHGFNVFGEEVVR